MSQRTEERLIEVAKWYFFHKNTISENDLKKRIEFLEKTIHSLLNLYTDLSEDVQALEGRKHLYLPRELTMRGDLKRFG